MLAAVAVTVEHRGHAAGQPQQRRPRHGRVEALNLTVIIVNDGFSLKAAGGNVAPGCQGVGRPVDRQKDGQYDYVSLNACAEQPAERELEFENERQFYVSANPGTEYQVIINVIDAMRQTKAGKPLFPDVNFKVSK